jgi:hypothetical protein
VTADPSPPGPEEAPADMPWEGVLCAADGERRRGLLHRLLRRGGGRPRHIVGEVEEEFAPPADWALSVWLAGAAAGVIAVIGGVVWLVQALPGSAAPAVHADSLDTGGGRNVVLVLTDGEGATVAAAVMNADARRATCVLAPRRLVLDVRGAGPTPLSAAFQTSDAAGVAAVSDTLGVRVDGAWRLSSTGLSTLVDTMGGVRVDTSTRFDATTGSLVEGKGPRTPLDGAAAAKFAIGGKGGPWEAQRLARFYAVLDGVLFALPDDEAQRNAVLARAGPETRSTLPGDQFQSFVGDLHRHARDDRLEDALLPVVPASRGGAQGYDLDAAKFETLLAGPLSHVRRPVKVLVDGEGVAEADTDEVRSKLEAARLSVVREEAGDESGVHAATAATRTTVASDDSPSAQTRARAVARALGLPESAVVVQRLQDTAYDVLVTLGADLQRVLRTASATSAAPTATAA